ncbi:MAG: protein kinase domain-containing protein [Candidatus Acidiferrum sp.]
MKICPQCQRSYPTSFAVCPQDGTRLTEPFEWAEGTIIRGKYKILGKIGEGGMGAVYKALHMHFNESCALKVMAPGLMNDTGLVKRFGREAIIARKLRHKNAVKVEDFDETEDGLPFIVMEYIEGESLKSLMNARGPLPVARTCSIIKQAAAALDAAHELGLVHRDIKPDNIVLVFSNGEEVAKVLDFGIAKIRDAHGSAPGMALTATGMVIGTPPYMSPEQAKGADSDEIDGRSDIYSLGVVMYQMLTGVLPLKGDTPLDMLFAQIQTPPTPIYEARPGMNFSEPVAALVMKCLEKDRARRPQSGRELIEELEACEKAEPGSGTSQRSKSSKDFSASTTVPETPAHFSSGARSANAAGHEDDPTVRTPRGTEIRRELFPKVPPIPTIPPAAAAVSSVESGSGADAKVSSGPASSSRTVMLVLAGILVVALGGGGWYFMHRSSSVGQPNAPSTTPGSGSLPVTDTAPATQPSAPVVSPPPSDGHGAEKSSERKESSERKTEAPKPKRVKAEASPGRSQVSEAENAARAKTVSATTALGDLYFENGEYDNAIKEYKEGLQADPSNKSLQGKLASAVKAKGGSQSLKPANP